MAPKDRPLGNPAGTARQPLETLWALGTNGPRHGHDAGQGTPEREHHRVQTKRGPGAWTRGHHG